MYPSGNKVNNVIESIWAHKLKEKFSYQNVTVSINGLINQNEYQ